MYINFIDLLNTDHEKLRNYLNTFGHIVVKGVLTRRQITSLNSLFVKLYEIAYQKRYNELTEQKNNIALEPVQKYVSDWLEVMQNINVFKIAEKCIGKDAIFCSSDASLFFGGSPIHRDQETLLPQYKINIYLQQTGDDGNGDFYILPGSQHAGDKYADFMNNYLKWPKSGGGYDIENLPFDPFSIEEVEAAFPLKYLNIGVGDILIFDDRMFHGTKRGNFSYERRLLTAVFAPNPHNYSDEYFQMMGRTRQYAVNELNELVRQGASKNGRWYYPHFFDKKYDFAQQHLEFLKITASKDYDLIGTHAVFKDNLSFNMQNRRFNLSQNIFMKD